MKMRSPIVAMLWENWRLTRVEAAQRLGLGIVGASGALVLFDDGATYAFWILVLLSSIFWFSISKLNGGRVLDGYKPGFPLFLLYTRPVPTFVFVGVAMAYDAVSCAALYVASAALVGFAFGQPLPLFSVTLWIVAFHLICTAFQWSTRNRVVQWVGSIAFCWPLFFLLRNNVVSPLQVEFSFAENALMVLIGVVSFGLTVAGVARQRRGDAFASVPRKAASAGYPNWLISLFRFSCPTSSATKAQVWFELKSSGLPILAIGLALAILHTLLFAISIPVPFVRPFAVAGATVFSVTAVLFFLGGNAFGIRRRQGHAYVSAFEATHADGTAKLAGLKVLVRTACVLAALMVIGVGVWTSSSLMNAWEGPWVGDSNANATLELLQVRRHIGDFFGGLTGYAHAALAVVTSIAIALLVASCATFTALRARYSRRVNITGSLLLLYGLAFVLFARAAQNGIVSKSLLLTMLSATGWIVAAATVFGTAYLVWRALAERVLTPGYVCGALVISAAFGTAWLTVLHVAGVQLAGMSATNVVSILLPTLLPLMASVLAPWSLNRIRHI